MKNLTPKCLVANASEDAGLFHDNVALVIAPLVKGEKLFENSNELCIEPVAPNESVAVKTLKKGDRLISLGVPFGIVTKTIPAGHVIRSEPDGNFRPLSPEEDLISIPKRFPQPPKLPDKDRFFFNGFARKVGQELVGVGIRNYVLVINTTKCSATATRNIAHLLKKKYLGKFANIDDVTCICHDFGCGMPSGKPKEEMIRLFVKILNSPNIGSIVLVGLGCEHLTVDEESSCNIIKLLREKVYDFEKRVRYAYLQKFSSEINAVQNIAEKQGLDAMKIANTYKRSIQPLKYLALGLQCGGSDRFSGVAANVVLGALSDLIVENGGKVILSESNELEGAIELLAGRAINKGIRKWLLELIPRFDKMCKKYPISGSGRQESVAPGNKDGGIHNVRLKSIGGYRKSGTKPIVGVLEYADTLEIKSPPGVYVLDSPSYDQISTSALFLAGVQVVAFTTGRGTTIGSSLGPVFKLGNRAEMGLRKHMDYVAEEVLDGKSPRKISEKILIELLDRMSGRKTFAVEDINQEYLSQGFPGIHDEFMFWKRWPDN